MELQAVTSQLYIVAGMLQDGSEVPGLVAHAAPARAARGRAHDRLFIHLTLGDNPAESETIAQDLLDAMARRYFATSGSVTAGLRDAILEANQLLLRQNMTGGGPRYDGAVTCAVLRGQELYIVQGGDSLALIGRNFGVERPPARRERMTPLGRSANLDLRYLHNWMEPGDMLLLADARLAGVPSEQMQPVLVDSTVEESLPLLVEIVGHQSARILLVEFTSESAVDLPATAGRAPRPTRSAGPAPPSPAAAPTLIGQPPAAAEPERSGVTLPELELPSAEDLQVAARRAGAQTARGLATATGWTADVMHRLRPGPAPEAEEEAAGWAVPLLIAVLIPIILAVVVGSVYIQRGRVTRFSELRRDMQAALIAASESAAEDEQRAQYSQALRLAAEAETLRPGNEEIDRMRTEALDALDRLEDVTRLRATVLYRYGAGAELRGVVLRPGLNGDLYTLDAATGSVYVHETEEEYVTLIGEAPERIITNAQVVGTHIVGTLIDLDWRPGGVQVTADGLAVLDGRGALLSYRPSFSDLRAVPLGLASEWLEPRAIAQFNERLYVLDSGAAQLWRYYPESDGFYVDEAQRALTLPDLDQAVDAAIYSEDGSVIVLYGDGRIRRYGQSLLWDETTLYANGLDTPLVAPTRLKIIGRGLNSSIFVADPGSGRIVQFSLGGTFLAQWKAVDTETGEELFSRLGDFDVADTPLRIFIAAGDALYVARQP